MSGLEIKLPFKVKKAILATGADIKSSLACAYGSSAFISETINDLQVPENFKRFKRQLSLFPASIGCMPRIIAYDKHPEYFSTKYILKLRRDKFSKLRFVPVQHHHAHIASCMLENGLKNQKVIGVAFDGTGLGEDQKLWGAEFLIADYSNFKRAAHLRYIPLLGGQKAILEPWRVAAAWLYSCFGKKFLDLDLDFVKGINKKNWQVLEKIWYNNFNSVQASSIGRLFDAVGALVLGIHKVKFEAEAAISLEQLVRPEFTLKRGYSFSLKNKGGVLIIDPVLVFKQITADLLSGISKEEISARFHLTVARMVRRVCLKIRKDNGINTVVLSGGVFQNKILSGLSANFLEKEGFRTLTHKLMPCSDLSLSLGQVAVASRIN
ncbi:MAG: hypothetical protein KJ838_00145 [Candidatus Omnitrophica bacterium]|nr:hypothetical protein [Candidatus Omnitrophota bacterium]